MTNRLDRLEEAGYIRRMPDPDDRRGVKVELTPAGQKIYRQSTAVAGAEGGADRLGPLREGARPAERPAAAGDDRVRGEGREALMAVVEATDLKRTYKTSTGIFKRGSLEVEAVRGVSFEIGEGELFGLLGPNGAGKTTTIKMLITLLIPTSGKATRARLRRRQGRARGAQAHRLRLRRRARPVRAALRATTTSATSPSSTRVPPQEQKPRIAELLELVGLTGREKERVEGYSRGMRQRLHIARGLLHDPPVVFLDEPTIGVDPVGARELRKTIASLTEAGKTVLLTTHYMFEADDLCDRIAVINKGTIVAEGTPRDLKAIVADRTVIEIETFGVDEATVDRLRAADGVTSVSIEDREQAQVLLVQSPAGTELTQSLLALLDGVVDRPRRRARADARGRVRGAGGRGMMRTSAWSPSVCGSR